MKTFFQCNEYKKSFLILFGLVFAILVLGNAVFAFQTQKPTIGIQFSDNGKRGCLEGLGFEKFAPNDGGWSEWASDSNAYDPDCARVNLSSSIQSWDQDFRFGIQITDNKCQLSRAGTAQFTPWASDGGGWSGWAFDDNKYDPDCARLAVETRPMPPGKQINDTQFGMQWIDHYCTGELGPETFTQWASSGGGWSSWASDDNKYDPDCIRIFLGSHVGSSVGFSGTIQVRATKDGQPWDSPPFSANYTGPSGTFTVSFDSPVDIPNLPAGAYSINSVTPPSGVTYSDVVPSFQTLSAGGTITFTFNFVTVPPATGTVKIEATKDGVAWDSPAFSMNFVGPAGTGGNVQIDPPATLSNMPAGVYTMNIIGAPGGVQLQNVTPQPIQTLSAGGTITFIFNFASIAQLTQLPPAVPEPAPAASCPSGKLFGNSQSLGGGALSDPVVENFGSDDRLIVVVRGLDNGVWIKEWKNGTLRDWYFLNGHTSAQPKLVVENNTLLLYIRGLDGFIYKNQYQGSGIWSGWTSDGVPNAQFGSAGPDAVATSWGIYRVSGLNPINLEICSAPPTGVIRLEATKDGQSWDSPAFTVYFEAANVGLSGNRLVDFPASFSDMPAAHYLFRLVQAPEGVLFQEIAPASSQSLAAGGIVTFTFRFISLPQQLQTLRIDPPSASLVEQATRQFAAWFDPDGPGSQSEREVTSASLWSSDNASVARVDAQGLVTGVAYSSSPVAIRAAYQNLSAHALVTVTALPVILLPTPPAVPRLSIDAGSLNVCGTIRVTWTNVADETYYELERNSGSGFVNTERLASDRIGFSDTAIAQNTEYAYRVRACNGAGCSAYSNVADASNRSPRADFSFSPLKPKVNQTAVFTDASVMFGGAGLQSRLWQFSGGNPATATTSPARSVFGSVGTKTARLEITDTASRSCSVQKDIIVEESPPNWIEVPPE